jgi:hypothetical protein
MSLAFLEEDAKVETKKGTGYISIPWGEDTPNSWQRIGK